MGRRDHHRPQPPKPPTPPPVVPPPVVPPVVVPPVSGTVLTLPAGTFAPQDWPDGVTVQGAGQGKTFIAGRVNFGNRQLYRDLTIGLPGNSAVRNKSGVGVTQFERCTLRGGGGTGSGAPVLALGFSWAARNITFTACEIERNAGTENSAMSLGFNNVTIGVDDGASVLDIVFDGCHIFGSPRMGAEIVTQSGQSGTWQRVTFRNTVVDVCDSHGLDFSDDTGSLRSTGVLIDGCTLKGGGKAKRNWGSTVDFEYPLGVVMRNTLIYRGWEAAVQMTNRGNTAYTGPGAVFTGNTVDLTVDNGITTDHKQLDLMGTYTWDATNKVIGA
jgi:hypothetical protein